LVRSPTGGAKLTSEMIERECQDIARAALEFLKAERLSGRRYEVEPNGRDPREDYLWCRMDDFEEALREDDFDAVCVEAEEIISRLGVVASEGSAEWRELCQALLHTHAEVYRVEAERHRGDVLAIARTPLNPMLADAFQTGLTRHMPSTVAANGKRHEAVNGEWSLEEACDKFIAAHSNGAWTAKTETQHRAILSMFKQFAGAGSPIGRD